MRRPARRRRRKTGRGRIGGEADYTGHEQLVGVLEFAGSRQARAANLIHSRDKPAGGSLIVVGIFQTSGCQKCQKGIGWLQTATRRGPQRPDDAERVRHFRRGDSGPAFGAGIGQRVGTGQAIAGDGHGGAAAADAADGTGAGGTGAGEGLTGSAESPVFADAGRAAQDGRRISPTWRSPCGARSAICRIRT